MAEMVKKFDVQAAQITQWKNQLLTSAETAFEKGDQANDEHEREVLEPRARSDNCCVSAESVATRGLRDTFTHYFLSLT